MIDFLKADAHIHLFEGGYQGGSLTSRPGVEVDELLCYQSQGIGLHEAIGNPGRILGVAGSE